MSSRDITPLQGLSCPHDAATIFPIGGFIKGVRVRHWLKI